MALLRQCLQELRLRRGETDLLCEGPQAVTSQCEVAAPVGQRHHDDAYADRMTARSGVIVVRAFGTRAVEPAWQ